MRCCALALILLTGCQTTPEARPFVAPEIVEVPVKTYVALPEELLRTCEIARAQDRKVGSVVEAYNRNITSLRKCNAQIGAIRGLQP